MPACCGAPEYFRHCSEVSVSLLDENANLGTAMRYEEIGEWRVGVA